MTPLTPIAHAIVSCLVALLKCGAKHAALLRLCRCAADQSVSADSDDTIVGWIFASWSPITASRGHLALCRDHDLSLQNPITFIFLCLVNGIDFLRRFREC
jgi:hypothetical protein